MSAATLAPPAPAEALALRPYQRDAADAVIAAYRRGGRRLLVHMATGLGKTVLFAHLAHTVVSNGRRALVIAHRDELLTQAKGKLLTVDPTADVGIVRAERDETDAERAREWLEDCMTRGMATFLRKVPVVVESTVERDWSGTPVAAEGDE